MKKLLTNEEIDSLTNLQVNVLMAETIHGLKCEPYSPYWDIIPYIYEENGEVFKYIDEPQSGSWIKVDYCENPTVTFPIMLKNRISITFCLWENVWLAFDEDSHNSWFDPSPLRAASIVYLKSLGVI